MNKVMKKLKEMGIVLEGVNEKKYTMVKEETLPKISIVMFDDLQLFNQMHNLMLVRKGEPTAGRETKLDEITHLPIFAEDIWDDITIIYKRKEEFDVHQELAINTAKSNIWTRFKGLGSEMPDRQYPELTPGVDYHASLEFDSEEKVVSCCASCREEFPLKELSFDDGTYRLLCKDCFKEEVII